MRMIDKEAEIYRRLKEINAGSWEPSNLERVEEILAIILIVEQMEWIYQDMANFSTRQLYYALNTLYKKTEYSRSWEVIQYLERFEGEHGISQYGRCIREIAAEELKELSDDIDLDSIAPLHKLIDELYTLLCTNKVYKVKIGRTSTRYTWMDIDAGSEEEAKEKALKVAGDYNYYKELDDVEYSVLEIEQ